jgi:hypothetical protein
MKKKAIKKVAKKNVKKAMPMATYAEQAKGAKGKKAK